MEAAYVITNWGRDFALDWEGVYASQAPSLLAYLTRLVHNAETASDLLQDTFVRAMRAEADLLDPGRVRPWLYRVATNVALRHLHRARIVALVPFREAAAVTVPGMDVEAMQVHTALASLPPDQAATLLLHYQQGLSRREIAEITGRSEEAIKSRLARGRANFMAAYQRLERGLK